MPVAIRDQLVLDYTMTAVGATENVDHTAVRPFVVNGNSNVCLVADAASTTQLSKDTLGDGGFNAISAAIVCAVANTQTDGAGDNNNAVAASLVAAQFIVAPTDVVRCVFTATNNTLDARHWASITPTAIAGA